MSNTQHINPTNFLVGKVIGSVMEEVMEGADQTQSIIDVATALTILLIASGNTKKEVTPMMEELMDGMSDVGTKYREFMMEEAS